MLGEKPVEKRLLTGATEYKQPLTLWSAAVLFGCGFRRCADKHRD
jgi:hypothetical protein